MQFLSKGKEYFCEIISQSLSRKREEIERLTSLSLIESALPIPLPFLKIGLTNSILLNDLAKRDKNTSENFKGFLSLFFLKVFIANIYSGLLFTPFFIASFFAGLSSAFLMYLSYFILGKSVSLYGVSILGAAVNCTVQIFFLSKFISQSVFYFLPFMLFFSLFSGFLTAFLAYKTQSFFPTSSTEQSSVIKKGKIKVLPYVFMVIFVVMQCLFSPKGKIIFSLFSLPVTSMALMISVKKASRLLLLAIISRIIVSFIFNHCLEKREK